MTVVRMNNPGWVVVISSVCIEMVCEWSDSPVIFQVKRVTGGGDTSTAP